MDQIVVHREQPRKISLTDCFAYALARDCACRLLYVGHDFSLTDVEGA
ncbi:type II toxin-antitoxin system VapC family toxin [Mesorhizobium sp. ORS 3428]|nr:type II toxin-antitoxin system VapC family toxin [Mesorhizobium sp. ORS 3428]